jgi:hypothetical protein
MLLRPEIKKPSRKNIKKRRPDDILNTYDEST